MVFAVTFCATSVLGQDFVWTKCNAPSNQWQFVTSSSDGMDLMAAAIYPTNGIWISTNAGVKWTKSATPIVNSWTCGASSSDGTQLAAADNINRGIYTSTNLGLTWTQTSAPTNQNWWSIASSSDGTELVAASGSSIKGSGIFTSINSGFTWQPAKTPTNGTYSVAASSDGTKMFAVDVFAKTIYVSTDSGQTWTQTIAPAKAWRCIASSSDGTKLVVGAGNGVSADNGIYTSTNSGSTWTPASVASEEIWFCMASSSDGTKTVAIASSGLTVNGKSVCPIYYSTNSGLTWAKTSAPATGFWSIAMSSDGTRLVAVSQYGEIYTATAPPSPTTPPSLTLQFFSGYPLLSLYGTLGDTYTVQYTTNLAVPNWTPMLIVPNLSTSPFQMIDPAGMGQPMRFYRAIQQ